MNTDQPDTRPPHKWVADKIDFSIAGVSLLRSGGRGPGFETMTRIEYAFGWPAVDQFNAMRTGQFASEFERVLEHRYTEEQEDRPS